VCPDPAKALLLSLNHQTNQPINPDPRGLEQEAFEDALKAAAAFRDIFDREADAWLDAAMVQELRSLRAAADAAHRAKRQQGEHSEVMNLAGEEIRRALKSASQGQKAGAGFVGWGVQGWCRS